MADSVYRVTEAGRDQPRVLGEGGGVRGRDGVQDARDLRIAEVVQLDLQLEDGRVRAYLARVKVSFKYDRAAATRLGRRPRAAALHLLTTQATGCAA